MASTAFDQQRHDYEQRITQNHADKEQEKHPARLPAIPDLRFELSYMRVIQPYLAYKEDGEERKPEKAKSQEAEDHDYEKVPLGTSQVTSEGEAWSDVGTRAIQAPSSATGSVARPRSFGDIEGVRWGKVLWVTTRDQVITPFLQGVVWAIAGYFLTPLSVRAGSRAGQYFKSRFPSKDGTAVTWLKKWARGLGLGAQNTDGHASRR